MKITVLHESWSAHPLAWIHRAEARSIANELRHAGHETRFIEFREDRLPEASGGPLLLRLSDPVMQVAASALTNVGKVYLGPAAGIMERCYDKYEAYRVAAAHGVDCPVTTLAGEAHAIEYPVILKPRRSSDSLGLRLLRKGPMPTYFRTENYIAQEFVRGADLTVAVLRDRVGMPLRLSLPEGVPYSFWRKYLLRPPRSRVADASLAERVRRTALEIARIFAVNWAARIDFILETAADRLRFLECDVVPLVGARSAFAASFEAAGLGRAEQLQQLIIQLAGQG